MYDGKKIMIGLSGGINSMAVLCWLIETGQQPKELHLFYAHFAEHSPDTFQFVADGIRYARKHFKMVVVKITNNSVLRFFEGKNMIPHPKLMACTEGLKIIPMENYALAHGIEVDLVGYVRKEKKRILRMTENRTPNLFFEKSFPIQIFDDEWCFEIVDKHIGWHPAIYDIKDENGKRVFTHNNCLPCKNMWVKDMVNVQKHFPGHMEKANDLSKKLKAYWGRNADDYYTEFGREDYEPPQCEVFAFD
jgi:hypothetical protein